MVMMAIAAGKPVMGTAGVVVMAIGGMVMLLHRMQSGILGVECSAGHQPLAWRARARRRAQHGRGHRAPHREQDRQDHQKPDAKEFHCRERIKNERLPAGAMRRQGIIVDLVTVGRSSGKRRRTSEGTGLQNQA